MRYYAQDGEQPATALEAIREQYGNDDLGRLVRAFGPPGKPPTRKDEMIAVLLDLVRGDALRATVDRLSPLERAAVAETAWSDDGRLDRDRFTAKYGRLPAVGKDDDGGDDGADAEKRAAPVVPMYYSQRQRSRPSSLLEVLIPQDVMAKDLQERLRGLLPRPAGAAVQTVDEPPGHVEQPTFVWNNKTRDYDRATQQIPVERRDMERAAAHDLTAVLRLADAGRVTITEKNRWPTPATLRAVGEALAGGDYYPEPPAAKDKKADGKKSRKAAEDEWEADERPGPIRAFAWPMLVQAGRLAQVSGNKLALTKAGRAALGAPPHEALRDLWRRWVDNDPSTSSGQVLLDELRRINVIRGQTGAGRRSLTDPAKRRRHVEDALRDCPVGRWVALDDFSRYMRAAGHRFVVTRDSWSLYIFDKQYGSLGYDGHGGWNILQFRYALCLLMEYAGSLGLIDVAYVPPAGARSDYTGMWGADDLSYFSRYDGLLYLRLNALGAYCLGLTETYASPPPEARKVLAVRPNLEVVATGPLSAADRMSLDAWGEPAGDAAWRLDLLKVLTAAAAGHDVGEMAGFLERSSGGPLPADAADFFADVAERRDALRDLGPARLIGVDDSALAGRVAGDPAARGAWYLVGQNLLVVPAKSDAAFRRALAKLGYVLPERREG